ncbi:Uncharacterised protein [Yersinia intermedia]|uniref:hypothetical protein n=1 Tax=Yersinia intermedia TaxID=631 RepID=UPI0005E1F0EC|nr:hypothetical protein [Yersinia intermedia]CNC00265.1 Uncharacterised protein [Yersinia intermedia]CNG78691.1 Uncharacterised protein [Yersinia intermedia]
MITGMPTKDDFYSTASHMVNEAWESVCELGFPYNKFLMENSLRKKHNLELIDLNSYWAYASPKLISAFSLVQQSVEFRLKGIICDISPYLLISNSVTSPPKKVNGRISFGDFYTLDAKDLLKVIDTFTNVNLDDGFATKFNMMRALRNSFMHSVNYNSGVTFESIIDLICYMHKNLNPKDPDWFVYRYNYMVTHSSNGIDLSKEYLKGWEYKPAAEYVEMFNVHVEFNTVINLLSPELTREHFNFIKNPNKKRSYECVSCSEKIDRSQRVHAKNDDNFFMGRYTVQATKEFPKIGVCAICKKNQNIK